MKTHTSRTGFLRAIKRPEFSRVASAVAMALAIPAAQTAYAQQQPPAGATDDVITITGSRIARRDYEANSPIQTLDASAFEQQSSIAIEDTLNDLPQFVPAATGMTQVQDGELINTGSTTTAGAATLSNRRRQEITRPTDSIPSARD